LELYRDILGFEPHNDRIIPDGKYYFSQETLDDIFQVQGAKSRMVLAKSVGGALLELQQPIVPHVQQTPTKYLGYGYTGISELALAVTGIEAWYDAISVAGYEVQTDYVWTAGRVKSFLFFDADGHMIQLVEQVAETGTQPAESKLSG
jgi:catechol 2,3-dioxygenase-like lactoylglutathione lyase family enzyme